ncbi:MAG: 30S ribosomal protein S20 [Gammaproteobacteria bacterium]
MPFGAQPAAAAKNKANKQKWQRRKKKFAENLQIGRQIGDNNAMANSAQSIKRARQAENRRQRGQMLRTRYRTIVKRARVACQKGDAEAAKQAVREMQSAADKTATKGIIHANAAARIKSRINAQLKKLPKAEQGQPAQA